MSALSAIEWTDRTWNPVTGCTKVSQGCKHCYAEGVAARFWATQYPPVQTTERERERGDVDVDDLVTRPRRFTDVQTHEDRLLDPLRWRKPARVFVNSMSDLFHEAVSDEFIDRVFAVMSLAAGHTFQVLTKRPTRMRAYLNAAVGRVAEAIQPLRTDDRPVGPTPYGDGGEQWWPLPNVWLGVSVEDQATADARIPLLLDTPAAVRFVSYEPALGPVDFESFVWPACLASREQHDAEHDGGLWCDERRLDWVIVGGESGPHSRPFAVEWARSTVQQCEAAGVPVFVKQLGSRPVSRPGADGQWPQGTTLGPRFITSDAWHGRHVNLSDRKGGDPAEWPEDLRVREFPRW